MDLGPRLHGRQRPFGRFKKWYGKKSLIASMWKLIMAMSVCQKKSWTMKNQTLNGICGLKLTQTRTLSHAIWRRKPSSLHSPICTMWECTCLALQTGKNMSQKYPSCWNLVYRHQNLSWPSLIPLLLTRHDQNFVSCKETYNYPVRESNTKNLVFGWKWPKLILLPMLERELYPVLESNSKNECFDKEWPKLVWLRRRHLQPASQAR